MKEKTHLLVLFFIFLISFFINAPGIQWGLPARDTIGLVVGDRGLFDLLLPHLIETRNELRTMVRLPGEKYSDSYDENRIIEVNHGGNIRRLTVGELNAIRTYFLRTYYPDEHTMIVALSNINPSKKEFNPKVLIPGCFYIYFSGFWLSSLNFAGIVNLKNDIGFYLSNPEEMRNIYLWMRILILLSFFASIYLLWFTVFNFWNKNIALISAFLFGVSPVLNLWNHFGYYYSFALPFVLPWILSYRKNCSF